MVFTMNNIYVYICALLKIYLFNNMSELKKIKKFKEISAFILMQSNLKYYMSADETDLTLWIYILFINLAATRIDGFAAN